MPLALITLWNRAKAVPPSAWGWAAAIIAVFILLSTCTVLGVKSDREQEQITRNMNKDRAIREEVGEVRAEDQQQINDNVEKLNEAVKDLPDGVPSARRTALACQRLRNDGHQQLPAVCGPPANRQAPAGPG